MNDRLIKFTPFEDYASKFNKQRFIFKCYNFVTLDNQSKYNNHRTVPSDKSNATPLANFEKLSLQHPREFYRLPLKRRSHVDVRMSLNSAML